MHFSAFIRHRLRDIDAVIRSQKKINPFLYIILRQFVKLVNIREENLKGLISDSTSKLYGLKFFTRKNSIDFLFCSKYYETETTEYIRSLKGDTFVNVGGHIGRFAMLASQNFRQVFAFEPQPSNFEGLTKNIDLNQITNIIAVNEAVSDREGIVSLSDLNSNTGWVYISDSGNVKVRCGSLGHFFKAQGVDIKKIDLVMIDAEGHELEVLKGGDRIFSEGCPQILLESFDVSKIEAILKGYGYKKVKTLDSYNHLFKKNS